MGGARPYVMDKIVNPKPATKKDARAPIRRNFDQEALAMHASGKPGKIEINATKPLTTQHDLSLA